MDISLEMRLNEIEISLEGSSYRESTVYLSLRRRSMRHYWISATQSECRRENQKINHGRAGTGSPASKQKNFCAHTYSRYATFEALRRRVISTFDANSCSNPFERPCRGKSIYHLTSSLSTNASLSHLSSLSWYSFLRARSEICNQSERYMRQTNN